MPSRKLVHPSSNRNDRRPEPKVQAAFTDVYEDEPASDIPEGTVAKAINCKCHGNDVEPRNGSILYTKEPLPPITGRTGYSAHKDGYIIISDSGPIFNKDDVSNLWGWDNGLYDEMTEYISTTRMKCRDNDPNSGTGCFMRGKINLWEWHRKKELWILQLGEELYIANREMTEYTLILIISRDMPSNSFSEYKEFDDDALIENSGGEYKIILSDSPPVAYRTNSEIPTIKIDNNEDEGEKNYKYRYFYSVARLDQNGLFRNRNDNVKILTESGLNKYYYEEDDEGDWAINNTEEPVGPGDSTYGVLYGSTSLIVGAPLWALVNNATVRFNINNYGYKNVIFDFSAVTTMDDVATVIQNSLRRYWPSATCTYDGTDNFERMIITSGRVQGGDVAYCLSGLGGQNSATNLGLTEATGATISNPSIDTPYIVRSLNIPYVGITEERQWHWTHYPIYRTADYGPGGMHLKTSGQATVNSPDFIVWIKDLRVAASFIARRHNGVVELWPDETGGEFERMDEGSVVEFEDSSRTELIYGGFIDSKNCRYRAESEGHYYGDNTDWMAAMIGNGRVARVTKTGTTVTRYAGSLGTPFTDEDVRKPVWWPNGTYSYIRSVTSANEFEVWDDREWSMTGITLDPTYRNYLDTVNDETLFGYSAGWTCKNRFFDKTKVADMISRQPGFILTAPRYGKEVNYTQMELGYRQFVGYHEPNFQKMLIEDQVLALEDFPNRFSVMGEGLIFSGVTNDAVELTIEGTLQKIFQLRDAEKVADFGISDAGSIRRIGEGLIRFITNLDEIRDFDGINYGDDLCVNKELDLKKITRVVQRAYPQFCSLYSRVTGYIWWWKS